MYPPESLLFIIDLKLFSLKMSAIYLTYFSVVLHLPKACDDLIKDNVFKSKIFIFSKVIVLTGDRIIHLNTDFCAKRDPKNRFSVWGQYVRGSKSTPVQSSISLVTISYLRFENFISMISVQL